MAREHARILTRIWDPSSEFRSLTPDAQRMYFLLLSQRTLNHAGVLPLTVKKWANCCESTSTDDVRRALAELDERRYIVVDEDTDEVLIRTFIRNDGVARQPNVLKAALRLAAGIESALLRRVLADELRRLDSPHAHRVADELTGITHRPPENPPPNPSRNPSENPSRNPQTGGDNPGKPVDENPSGTLPEPFPEPIARDAGEGEGEGGKSPSVGGYLRGARARENKTFPTTPAERPNPRCPKHHTATTPGPCGACKDARLAAEAWDQAQTDALRNCRLCTNDGYRLVPGRGLMVEPPERCDHRPLRSVS